MTSDLIYKGAYRTTEVGLWWSGVDKVREWGELLLGNDRKNWRNHDISVNGIWREIFSLKLCSWGRKHFVHSWSWLYSAAMVLLGEGIWLCILPSVKYTNIKLLQAFLSLDFSLKGLLTFLWDESINNTFIHELFNMVKTVVSILQFSIYSSPFEGSKYLYKQHTQCFIYSFLRFGNNMIIWFQDYTLMME